MGMYAKLMSRITESSLMEEPIDVRYCFMMMLAIADPQGYVVGTDVAIARRMNMPMVDFERCLAELMKPDVNSNSKEQEGRRVVNSDCERGYYLVNYTKYRDTRNEEDRRDYMRNYMRKQREDKNKQKPVSSVNFCKQKLTVLAQVQEEVEVEASSPTEKSNNLLDDKSNSPLVKPDHATGKYHENSIAILECLNRLTGLHYRPVDANLRLVSARLREAGVETTGVEQMLVRMVSQWRGTDMEQYLRPATLFGKEKFDIYYAARLQPVHTNGTNSNHRNAGLVGNKPLEEPRAVRILRERAIAAKKLAESAQNTVATQMALNGNHSS